MAEVPPELACKLIVSNKELEAKIIKNIDRLRKVQ